MAAWFEFAGVEEVVVVACSSCGLTGAGAFWSVMDDLDDLEEDLLEEENSLALALFNLFERESCAWLIVSRGGSAG